MDEFNREERARYWRNEWPEPMSEQELQSVVDSEEIDDVLLKLESLAGSLEGAPLASLLASLKKLLQ